MLKIDDLDEKLGTGRLGANTTIVPMTSVPVASNFYIHLFMTSTSLLAPCHQ